MKEKNAVCFGEILWDLFPDGKKMGGAPLNVAFRMNALGIPTRMISAIGDDPLGKELEETAAHTKVATLLQKDTGYPTGTVDVFLNAQGSATYTIVAPVAWDAIHHTQTLVDLVTQADCFVFGSLVARHATSRNTLEKLLPLATFAVFDVNLRKPHYDYQTLEKLMKQAHLVKCNEDELAEIAAAFGHQEASLEAQILCVAKHTHTPQICVTLGAEGAVWYHDNTFLYQKGFTVQVQDTVGAGDSFLGTLLSGILTNKPPKETLAEACAVGSLVASKKGANPKVTQKEIHTLLTSHN